MDFVPRNGINGRNSAMSEGYESPERKTGQKRGVKARGYINLPQRDKKPKMPLFSKAGQDIVIMYGVRCAVSRREYAFLGDG